MDLTADVTIDQIVFDCDSTLSSLEGTDELARMADILEEVEAMTVDAMGGDVSYEDIYEKRLNLIQPKRSYLERLGELYVESMVEDLREVIEAAHLLGKKIFVISGGYVLSIAYFAGKLGIPKERVIANDLLFDEEGNYLGPGESPTAYSGAKRELVEKIARRGSTAFVGDAVTDMEAQGLVDLFIGYGGVISRDAVRDNAEVFLEHESLASILVLVCSEEEVEQLEEAGYGSLVEKGKRLLKHRG